MFLRHRSTLVPIALLAAFSGIAFGFDGTPDNGGLEIPRPGWGDEGQWIGKAVHETGLLKTSPVGALEERYGGNWHYQRNRVTGSFHNVYGSGVDIAGQLLDRAAAENAARSVVGANQGIFGADEAGLRTSAVRRGAGKWAVHFDQLVGGLRVVGGTAYAVFTESGRLFAMGSDVYPDVDISTTPALSESGALSIAKSDIGFLDGRDKVYYNELLILPVRNDATEEAQLEYRLAYRFDLDVVSPLGNWVTYVDARTGEIVWRYNMISTVDLTGHAQGDAEIQSYCDGVTPDYPMAHMDVDISGAGTATTDGDGDFTLPYGGTDTKSWSAGFSGPWIDITRYTGSPASQSGSITPGTPLTIDWSNANSIPAERNLFYYINREHDWLLDLDPSFTEMDYQAPCVVERTDGYCPGNAWYSYADRSINFCQESATYGNTGRIGDVAYHEYGHGITHQVYISSSQPRSSLHEGNSDIVANLLTRSSIIGLGFYVGNCASGIRNSNNTMQYPDDWSDSHTGGQIIAGFVWDSWQSLLAALPQDDADSIAAHGWHYARRLGLPQTEPDQVYWTFIADDDDGNLDNGTPNHAAWCVGATNHGFDCPAILSPVEIVHTPVSSHSDESSPIEVAATITSTAGAINESALAVYYQVDGGSMSSVGMSSTGGDGYSGYIPAQAAGSMVEYYIYAEDNAANSSTDPLNAPFALYTFFVGDFQTVFADDFESDQGWSVGDVGDDATTGVWELGDPQGTTSAGQLQPEDDHTPAPGTDCYATQLAAGSSGGTYDVDGGKTTLFSPVIDLSGVTVSQVRYWRWYTNDQGNSPGLDVWQVSVNDGSGWVDLENTTASDNSWSQRVFGLNAHIDMTGTVQFRFIASDEDPGSLVEAAVDDFEILGISPSGVDSVLSTITANDHVVTCPAGDGDSTLTITVTVIDEGGSPMAGIPAGDVVVDVSGVSSLGQDIMFCGQGQNSAQFVSTSPTNGSGEATIQVTNLGGCGSLTLDATVSGVHLAASAAASVKSSDFNGDGYTTFSDVFQYLPDLNAGTGSCGNLSNDGAGIVNFNDTTKFLSHLATNHQCP